MDPAGVTWIEDASGRLFVELRFAADPKPWLLPYSDIIHLRRNYGADEYMGGGPGNKDTCPKTRIPRHPDEDT